MSDFQVDQLARGTIYFPGPWAPHPHPRAYNESCIFHQDLACFSVRPREGRLWSKNGVGIDPDTSLPKTLEHCYLHLIVGAVSKDLEF